MKILNFGSMNLDYVYDVASVVRRGETISSPSMKTVPGGKGLNQSVALAKAGAEVLHAGCCGEGGGMLKNLLAENGVNTENIADVSEPQGNAIIQVDAGGDNAIIVLGGSNRCLTREAIDAAIAKMDAGDMVLTQNEVNDIAYLLHKAHEAGLVTILNPSPMNDEIDQVDLGDLSWLIMNETETLALTGKEDPKEAYSVLKNANPAISAVITLGEGGAWCMSGDEVLFQSAFKVKAVDSTAAGDTFTGFFFGTLLSGGTLRDAMVLASKAAAISVTRPGASVSIPALNEVRSAEL